MTEKNQQQRRKKRQPNQQLHITGLKSTKAVNTQEWKWVVLIHGITTREDGKIKKITPDKWEISYAVTKRRAGKAPEGSGVPVGTEYHWYILAHQKVKKLDANNYSTEMQGIKYKLAHKRFDKENWSASDKAQKKKLIKLLQQMIDELETELQEDK